MERAEAPGEVGELPTGAPASDPEARLGFQLTLEKFVTSFSTRLLGARDEELDGTIGDSLAGISAIFGLDRAYVVMAVETLDAVEFFQEWWSDRVQVVSIPVWELPPEARRFWVSKLVAGDVVYLPTLDQPPEGGEAAVEALMAEGVKSILFLPLSAAGRPVGFFGFEARREAVAWTDDSIRLMRTVGELFVGAIGRRRAERALASTAAELEARNAELERSNRDLEDFAAIASHDLKAPLPIVRGFVELLGNAAREAARGGARPTVETVDDYVSAALRGVARLNGIIDDILSFARARNAPLVAEPVDLDALVRALADDVVPGDVRVTIQSLPTVMGERSQLAQLFLNLLTNAVKFQRPDAPAVIDVSAERVDDAWHMCVADDGIGIGPADRMRVFEMFTRVETERPVQGTGIGLAVCARIAESHGGRIWIADCARGTHLVVALPAPPF